MAHSPDYFFKEYGITDQSPLSLLQLDPADRAVLKIADVRDAVQKKTFTKWVNKHLLKCRSAGRRIVDLFEDLRDGHNLISLLEVLAHESLPREKGRMKFHKIQNVQIALEFLRRKGIKLVNIRSDEIVDGNPKLSLGLIWTIILHYQGDVVTFMGHYTQSLPGTRKLGSRTNIVSVWWCLFCLQWILIWGRMWTF
ncbi:dystonin [Mytilus galloprovincialis]|uniref:Dystonin n=1 Tax=Mytilus galloprovincialis TaxID=29158 RepID=A0A8B6H0M6_MYTGA|nr:dystonin [Mytilus galloprovincialis]